MLNLLRFFLFFGLFFLGFALYYPGLDGGLYFDDNGNLQTLGADGGVQDFPTLWQYLNSNDSGPTGRPISMASFLINDNNWPPASIFSFKYTNVLLHLLNGVLVFWLIWLLLKKQAYRFALSLIVTAWWLLHPMQVSTTLYVVQRMAELSALFTLLGMIGYLYGRSLACRKPRWGFMTMSVSLGAFGLLAIFSKENGVLLLFYLLVIEFFWLRPSGQTPPAGFRRFASVFLYLPAALFALYLLHIGYSALNSGFPFRDFTPVERFYSQLGIAFDYLRKILLPPFGGWGIYQDDYPIMQSFWQPFTLLAALGWLTLIVLAFVWRQKYWVFSFAVAWFIAGHLLETFAITGLELAFLHRNYLAMLGVLLAMGYAVFHLQSKIKELLWLAFAVLLIYSTWVMAEQAKVWGGLNTAFVWAAEKPKSPRAQYEAFRFVWAAPEDWLDIETKRSLLEKYLDQAIATDPDGSGYYLIKHWYLGCRHMSRQAFSLDETKEAAHLATLAQKQPSFLSGNLLSDMYTEIGDGRCNLSWASYRAIIEASKQQPQADFFYAANLDYLAALAATEERDFYATVSNLEEAYNKDPHPQTGLMMTDVLLSAGLPVEALEYLSKVEILLDNDWRKRWIAYQPEVAARREKIMTLLEKTKNEDEKPETLE